MPLPTDPTSSWMQGVGFPSRLFDDTTGTDYELYEEDGEFVLTIELPGFNREEIDLAWDDGVLNIAAEHVDDDRGQKRTYHRRFRFPKDVAEDAISASYSSGILEVTLPVEMGTATRGTAIPIEG
jgi:HSP20 family protein